MFINYSSFNDSILKWKLTAAGAFGIATSIYVMKTLLQIKEIDDIHARNHIEPSLGGEKRCTARVSHICFVSRDTIRLEFEILSGSRTLPCGTYVFFLEC